MNLISGTNIAKVLLKELKTKIDDTASKFHTHPGLAVILIGNNPASKIYVNNKIKRAKEVGINTYLYEFPENISEKILINKIHYLNNDSKIHGILVQLPLPEQISSIKVINEIDPKKDVDGFHPSNIGKLIANQPGLYPCTAVGTIKLLESVMDDFSGKYAVVVGRSMITGKPISQLLLNKGATVTSCHSKTKDLQSFCNKADILVVAIGKPQFIGKEYIKPGAVVIDVGVTKLKDKIIGDVKFEEVKDIASYITPVPGGVGPMTIACLLENTYNAMISLMLINKNN